MTKKSGLADSPFFAPAQPKIDVPTPPPAEPTVQNLEPVKTEKPKKKKAVTPSNHDTVIPRHHDTMPASNQDSMQPEIHGVVIDIIRKAVKEVGKEAATHRFTITEKKELADLIYTYKNRGIKTTENEIARIAVNFIIEDYKVNGENSVLHKLLKALRE
jgi:hypothetical protein